MKFLPSRKVCEILPDVKGDGRVIKYADQWYVAIPVSEKPIRPENQGRLVSLDPEIRSFQTFEIKNIGGAKLITSGGITVERDINGARGIFLRALVDSPSLLNQGAS